MYKVHHEGLECIVPVMAEHDGLAAFLAGDAVEDAPAQARAHGTIGAPGFDLFGDDGIGVFGDDLERHANRGKPVRQHVLRKARLALVKVAGNQVNRQGALPLEIHQHGEQAVGILAA